MLTPLHGGWVLAGDALPERLLAQSASEPAFSLPGAEALRAFADLIGDMPEEAPQPAPQTAAPFPLPALIPEDVTGEVTLSREIDFASLSADAAWLSFDMLCGRGSAVLESLPPRFSHPGAASAEGLTLTCDFDCAPVTLDVSSMLRTHRRARLTLRFSAARPAGVCGAVLLRTAVCAHIADLTVTPDGTSKTLSFAVRITAKEAGDYRLHACLCPADASAASGEAPLIRETGVRLAAGETQTVSLTMAADLPAFVPGEPFAAPAVKLWLYRAASSGRQSLCDAMVRLCGFPGPAPAYTLPLCAEDLRQMPEALLSLLSDLHVPGVLLSSAAPELLYRMLTRAGISALHSAGLSPESKGRLQGHPCAAFSRSLKPDFPAPDPVLSAWQLGGLITYPRPADPDMLPAELLRDAAGREADLFAEDTQAVLAWLRAVSIRLRAEAMRQGRLRGALCAPGEYRQSDVMQAIKTALSSLHLSALPLSGAWWTGAHFSASLQAFIPRDAFPVDKSIRAVAALEDGEGNVIARTEYPCAPWRSGTGLLQAVLPDAPCVLELVTRLYADETILEESTMPVYVGARGVLEAAFDNQAL